MDELIADLPDQTGPAKTVGGAVRLRQAERRQVAFRTMALDDLIGPEHLARLVWQMVERFDMQPLLDQVTAREGRAGHPQTDPAILISLWLYATLEGIGSARELARLCEAHAAYRWLCGGVSMNHHTLADVRVDHADWLDAQLVASIAALLASRTIDLQTVAQDGLRVRASAGGSSFRREPRLREFQRLAAARVAQVRAQAEADPKAQNARKQAAEQRAAAERLARVEAALAAMPEARDRKKRNKGEPDAARVSTTDPQARVMKMPDGGFRPAYNVQFCAETRHGLVVGVAVTTSGADHWGVNFGSRLTPGSTYEAGDLSCGGVDRARPIAGASVNVGRVDARWRSWLPPVNDRPFGRYEHEKAPGPEPWSKAHGQFHVAPNSQEQAYSGLLIPISENHRSFRRRRGRQRTRDLFILCCDVSA